MLGFGALGELAIGGVGPAGPTLTQINSAGPGALGQFSLGEWGEPTSDTIVTIPAPINVAVVFPAPIIRSGAAIRPPLINVAVAFGAPRIAISATVTVPAPINVAVVFPAPIIRSGAAIRPPLINVAVAFGAPSVRSGAAVQVPAFGIAVAFPSPEINARIRRVKTQAILS